MMKHSELINKIHHGEEGFLYLPFDDFVTLAKVLLNRGYAVMITGGEMEDKYRIDWVYAGHHDNLDYANRDMVCFGSNDFLEMLEFGDYEDDEAPTIDAVEVVRCKDCKHVIPYESGGFNCLTCPNVDRDVDENWFCADGEMDDEVN